MIKRLAFLCCAVAIGCGANETAPAEKPGYSNPAPSASISCVYTEVITVEGRTTSITFCIEPPGLPASEEPTFRAQCEVSTSMDAGVAMSVTGVYATNGCSRANVVGGCRMQSGGMLVTVWFPVDGATTADAFKRQCEGQAGVFVTP